MTNGSAISNRNSSTPTFAETFVGWTKCIPKTSFRPTRTGAVEKKEWLEMVGSDRFPVDAIESGDFRLRRYRNVAITGWSDYVLAGAVVWSVRRTQVRVDDGQRRLLRLGHGTPKLR